MMTPRNPWEDSENEVYHGKLRDGLLSPETLYCLGEGHFGARDEVKWIVF
jgi:hypothetical protein